MKVLVAQSCPIFCEAMDCSLAGSSVHGILQARILEWVAIPFSRRFSQPREVPILDLPFISLVLLKMNVSYWVLIVLCKNNPTKICK